MKTKKMTYKDVIDLLESYGKKLEGVDKAKELYARVYSTATSATSNNAGGWASGVIPGDKIGNSIAELGEIEEKILRKAKDADRRRVLIEGMIERIPDELSQKVLHMTYIDLKDRSYIAHDLHLKRTQVDYRKRKGINWMADHLVKKIAA